MHIRTGVEEVFRLKTGVFRSSLFAPRAYFAGTVGIDVLKFRHLEWRRELCAVRNWYTHLAFSAFLGGNHYHTLCSRRAIERGSRRSAKHTYRLYIFGVEVGDSFTARLLGIHTFRRTIVAVVDGNTVYYIQGLVALVDRFRTTHHHASGTTHTGRRGIDVDTCHLAGERVHKVGALYGSELFASHLLHIITKRLLRALDAQGSHNHLFELEFRLFEYNGKWLSIIHCLSIVVAEIFHHHYASGRSLKHKIAIDACGCCFLGSFNCYCGTDYRLAILVEHLSGNCAIALLLRYGCCRTRCYIGCYCRHCNTAGYSKSYAQFEQISLQIVHKNCLL